MKIYIFSLLLLSFSTTSVFAATQTPMNCSATAAKAIIDKLSLEDSFRDFTILSINENREVEIFNSNTGDCKILSFTVIQDGMCKAAQAYFLNEKKCPVSTGIEFL